MFGRSRKSVPEPDEVSVVIDAPAARLYDLVSDVTKMGRLSPECKGGRWLGGADGPAVGARFRGHNRRGPVVWVTRNEVVAADRAREFAFQTRESGARWRYRFEPAADGEATVVTESRQIVGRRPLSARLFTALLLGGVGDHDDEMREGMRASLERLKTLAEAEEPSGRRRRSRSSRRGRR